MSQRIVVWFSCGAASAVTAKLAIEKYGSRMVTVVYCDLTADENGDNRRFMLDVERWIGAKVRVIRSKKFLSVEEVFEKRRYMSGIAGAPCTVEMKKIPRFDFQQPDDLHLFGYTIDEGPRIERFISANPELNLEWILRDHGLSKPDCFKMLTDAGIELPAMYKLGYRNNNCIGCVKATSPRYWSKIKEDFPEVFRRRAEQSRRLGVRLAKENGRRIFLDELAPTLFGEMENISCGPECATDSHPPPLKVEKD